MAFIVGDVSIPANLGQHLISRCFQYNWNVYEYTSSFVRKVQSHVKIVFLAQLEQTLLLPSQVDQSLSYLTTSNPRLPDDALFV